MSDNTDLSQESVVERLYQHYRYAGAASEGSYDFDGGFSYHAESHAFGVGFGVGVTAAATNEYKPAGIIVSIIFGLDRGSALSDGKIAQDIRQEPHYALFGLALGIMLGNAGAAIDVITSVM